MSAQSDKKRVLLVTRNTFKLKQFEHYLGDHISLMRCDIPLQEIQSLNQEEIVRSKARQAYQHTSHPVITDDSGLYINRYNGFPGPLANHVFIALGANGLFRLFDEGDAAYFQCSICYKDGDREDVYTGVMDGHLTKACELPVDNQTPYSSFFIPSGFFMSYSELSTEVQLQISHRRAAAMLLIEGL